MCGPAIDPYPKLPLLLMARDPDLPLMPLPHPAIGYRPGSCFRSGNGTGGDACWDAHSNAAGSGADSSARIWMWRSIN